MKSQKKNEKSESRNVAKFVRVYIDHTTGKKYKTAKKLGEDLYCTYGPINNLARIEGNRFKIYGHDIEVIQTTVRKSSRIIECLETGEIFPSISEAARSLEISHQSLCWLIRSDRTYEGKKYQYLRGEEEIEALCSFKAVE